MSAHSRIFATCTLPALPGNLNVDLQSLIERLILFDHYVLSSNRLKELPDLVNIFGYGPMMELLKSKRISIYSDAVTMGSLGQKRAFFNGRLGAVDLPLGSFSFGVIRNAKYRETISEGMAELDSRAHLKGKALIAMKGAVQDRLLPRVEEEGNATVKQLNQDFAANHPVVTNTTAVSISELLRQHTDPRRVRIKLHIIASSSADGMSHDFRAESNLGKEFGLSAEKEHELLERALLGVSGLNQRLEYMSRYDAVAPFKPEEASLIDDRFAFLYRTNDPESLSMQFRRIVSLTDFPDLGTAAEAGEISLEEVLKISQSDECVLFRNWLQNAASLDDAEIREAFGSTRAKLAGLLSGTTGKTIRWLASTGLGAVPVVGPVIGAAAGFADTFFVEKILPKAGPIAFLKTHYDSIFRS